MVEGIGAGASRSSCDSLLTASRSGKMPSGLPRPRAAPATGERMFVIDRSEAQIVRARATRNVRGSAEQQYILNSSENYIHLSAHLRTGENNVVRCVEFAVRPE